MVNLQSLALPPDMSLQEGTLDFLSSDPKMLLINGEWKEAASGETFPTINPATGEVLARVALAGQQDVDLAVDAARRAFESGPWTVMHGDDRARLLWRVAELIERYADELSDLETLDNGKSLHIARKGNIPMAARHFRYYAGWAGKIADATLPVSHPDHLVYTLREPV